MPLFITNVNNSSVRNLQLKILKSQNYPRERILDPQNVEEKKFWTNKIPRKENFPLTKYSGKKILDSRNTHEITMTLDHQDPG